MKKSNLFLTALCILISYSMLAQYSISGVVKDTLNQTVFGALVKIENTYQATYSDPDGAFKLTNLPNGSYEVSAEILGKEKLVKTIIVAGSDVVSNFSLSVSPQALDEVSIQATRVKGNAPVAHVNVTKEDYEKINLGQDMASLIKLTPSVVTTSDAGGGVGYTGFRIRGSDASRINITVNGIPINDAESHGVYWVNMPDIASSTQNIQIQRGVGSSTNGAAAFGASVNLQTDLVSDSAYAEISSSYGSFNTNKNTIRLGTGLINKHWAMDGRLSSISSDGYVDRASANLSSYFLQGGYYGDKTIVKAITFAGKEKTYQAWWGTPEAKLNNDTAGISATIANNVPYDNNFNSNHLDTSGRTYNFYLYDNQVDNYAQDHYQLHLTHEFNDKFTANASLHYTYGRGYYEENRIKDSLLLYDLNPVYSQSDTIHISDFIRRRWLDNHFYGGVYNLRYTGSKANIILGGGYNEYVGDHFGEIIWAEHSSGSKIRDKFYANSGKKTDFNSYLKSEINLSKKVNSFIDLQVRSISYSNNGKDFGNDIGTREIGVDKSFTFFNPKLGLTYQIHHNLSSYASFSVANREPVRNDFIDNDKDNQPSHETLFDYEAGAELRLKKILGQVNLYYMDYTNQLVNTGALSDVGSNLRTNVKNSFRGGIELVGSFKITKKLNWNVNTTLSQNKIAIYTEDITRYNEDWSEDDIQIEHTNTDISLSPSIIAGSLISYQPSKGLELGLQTKYVGKQYLDNTQSDDRDLPEYFVSDFMVSYTTSMLNLKQVQFNLLVNNIFNEMYSSKGYTWGFISGDRVSENWLYPQAGTNLLAGVTVKF